MKEGGSDSYGVRVVRRFIICSAVLFLSSAFGLRAQEMGSIVGTVTDPTGAVIPTAQITVTNQQTRTVARTATTNAAGNYMVAGLPVSTYTVRVQKQGFTTAVHSDLELNVRSEVRVDFTMTLGAISAAVNVVASSVHLQTENAAVGEAVTATHVEAIDINGRNFVQLATLVPGAAGQSLVGSLNTPVGVTANTGINFNGLRQAHNVWSVDGEENYDRGCGGCIEVVPDQDAIQEFKVLSSNASQDLGFGSAAHIQVELKSGTQSYHGEAFEFNRNRALETQPFFLNKAGVPRPKENYNNFGFNLGGPIGRPGHENKTFFFVTLDWRKLLQGNTFNVNGIPLPWTTGDFSTNGSDVILDKSKPGVPCTDSSGKAQTCLPAFSGNIIPAAQIDPNAKILAAPSLGLFLQPNSGNRLISGFTAPLNVNEQIVRIDHQFSDRTSLMAHYIRDGIVQQFPRGLWSVGSYPTVGTNFLNEPESILLKLTHNISPTLLNEAMVGFNRQPLTLLPYGVVEKPSGLTIQKLFPGNDPVNRIPLINIGGSLGVLYTTGSWPWTNVLNTWTFRDSMTKVSGNHTLNFGVEILHYLKQQRLFGQTNGNYNFDASGTNGFYLVSGVATSTPGNAFADFMLGKAQQYTELQTQGIPAWLNTHIGPFIGDNWKVRNGLTLNLGLRWEGMPHAYEQRNQAAVFRAQLFDPALAAAAFDKTTGQLVGFNNTTNPYLNGIGIAGKQVPRGLVNNHWYNFEPRVGFAWQPRPGGKTVIRGGIGQFYENIQGNDVYNVGPNPPFSSTPQINPSQFSFAGCGLAATTSLTCPGGLPGTVNPGNIQAYEFHYWQPYSFQWNFGGERQFTDRVIFSLAYVGNSSFHQSVNRNINQPLPSVTAYPAPGVNAARPYLGWANINFYDNVATANYNSLQASLRISNWHGLTTGAAYTYSHCIDYVDGDLGGIPSAFDLSREKGHCGYDIRHMLVWNYVYSLPFFSQANGIKRSVLGGWQVSGISTFYSGLPLTIATAQPDSSLAHCNCSGYRANVVGDPRSGAGIQTVDEWFNTSAFAAAQPGSFGTGARNIVRGAGINNWDFSIFKTFAGIPLPKSKEGGTLQFRFEFYNLPNHTQFNAWNTTWTPPSTPGSGQSPNASGQFFSNNFGQATGTRLPRQIQIGAKLRF